VPRFFIDRPIFAWVIAIIIMLAGIFAINALPIEQYPNIAPTTVDVSATYPGASAKTLEDSVTQVIAQSLTGIDRVLYISSSSSSQGSATVSLTFLAGTDPDIAQVQVQNKLQQALTRLPQPVQAQGVKVTKSTSGFLVVYGFYSPDASLSRTDIGDYLVSSLVDPLSRVDGVGTVQTFGSGYAMRVWLDPYRLDQYGLIPADISRAISAQNAQVAAGQLGHQPVVTGQQLNAIVTAQTKLSTPAEFRDIVLRVNPDGSTVRLGDVARIELGAENYDDAVFLNGRPAVGVAIALASGANALQTADAVNERVAQLARFMPPGISYTLGYDNATFIRVSIAEVVKTLFEAIALVVLIMFLFLQNLRATLIPAIAVPVVLLGTCGVLLTLGYTINTLTMFGLVLAIGLLVDDAIVVVENVERIMREEKLGAREATIRSMEQITGALLGIALVLSAVLVPMAFFGGSTGVIYRQFSITMVSAMALSVLVALTLSPALCATILRPKDIAGEGHGGALAWFEHGFGRLSAAYQEQVRRILPHVDRGMLIYLGLVGLMALLFVKLPTSFLPDEDQGYVMTMVQLPPGATLQRTIRAQQQFEALIAQQRVPLRAVFTVSGRNFSVNGQNAGMSFIRLLDWDARTRADQSAAAIARRTARSVTQLRDATIYVMTPPQIRGLGNGSGFELALKDVGGVGRETLGRALAQLLGMAAKDPLLVGVRRDGLEDQPEFHLEVDGQKAAALGLAIADVNDTLSSAIGGSYVNDFVDRGRVKKVYIQADAPFRMQPGDLDAWFVRNASGGMVPMSAIATGRWTLSPPILQRYNGASSHRVIGDPAAGVSSGTALREMEHMAAQLPPGVGYEWSGISYQEKLSGAQAPLLYAVSVLFVFLCLAALYESWSLPFSVMLVVPLGVIGALAAAWLRGLSNDVYFQVGLLTTVGLSAKNAILIVEFAKTLYERGASPIEAVQRAVRIRLRPILMTSLSFMLGVLPLVLSSGAGAGGRIAIGTGVFGGMFAATVFSVFFVPLFFLFVQRLLARPPQPPRPARPPAPAAGPS
jgi:multidrug efflux pump